MTTHNTNKSTIYKEGRKKYEPFKTILIFLLSVNYLNTNAQSFVPISSPGYPFINAECAGGNDHYVLFGKGIPNDTNYLYRFDGNVFYPIDSFKITPNYTVYCIGYADNEIYIGGAFDTINGSILTDGLFKYSLSNKNITTTADLFQGNINVVSVKDIKQWNGQVLMGGSFVIGGPGGLYNPLIIGNNLSWSAFDTAVYGNGSVCTASNQVWKILIEDNNRFYITGAFSYIDSLLVNEVAYWNNGQWTALGNGLPDNKLYGIYYGIAKQFEKLFVAHADSSSSQPVISYFDGNNWAMLNNPTNGSYKILSNTCGLFVTNSNVSILTGLALYDEQLGFTNLSGVEDNSIINYIFEHNDSVYVKGTILVNSQYKPFGRVDCTPLVNIKEHGFSFEEAIYPNPALEEIQMLMPLNETATIKIFNNYGQCVKTFYGYSNKEKIMVSNLLPGIYFIHTIVQNSHKVHKLVKPQ